MKAKRELFLKFLKKDLIYLLSLNKNVKTDFIRALKKENLHDCSEDVVIFDHLN